MKMIMITMMMTMMITSTARSMAMMKMITKTKRTVIENVTLRYVTFLKTFQEDFCMD